MTTHRAALRHWFVPVASTTAVIIALIIFLKMAGVILPQPLEQTRLILSLKWGLIVAAFLQTGFAWRDHRKYSVTAASLANIPELGSPELPEQLRALDKDQLIDSVVSARIRRRGAFMLGNVTAALVMLAGLYVITKSTWYLLAILIYASLSAWIFRPADS